MDEASARGAAAEAAPPSDNRTPADRYRELFVDVQRSGIFDDCKTFVDCAPLREPAQILAAYRRERMDSGFDLRSFVQRNFATQHHAARNYRSPPGQSLEAHIDGLWDVLTRHPVQHPRHGSLLRVPHPYVVPGGRFMEMYYWDSYFTMLGLAESGREVLLHAMTDNFAYLIDTYGHVPNGTRTYYLSRSQPPVFALMAELCEVRHGQGAIRYLPQMLREHAFWMAGADRITPGHAHRRIVALPDGSLLNRYWDDRDTPREESWREDVATAAQSERPAAQVYRDLRAAAESGWDFSSRWFGHGAGSAGERTSMLSTICTTQILPVDLNAFLHKLETTIARLSAHAGQSSVSRDFESRADRRRIAMNVYLWDAKTGAFLDYDWREGSARKALNAATVTPLLTLTATARQAEALAATLRRRLLSPGGLATTEMASGEQWDRPNGWAPLQWMAVKGLEAYGQDDLAAEIRRRWLKTVGDVYAKDRKLVEKYALRPTDDAQATGGGGGEYPLQDGFGWTNGVVRNWLQDRGRAPVRQTAAPAGAS